MGAVQSRRTVSRSEKEKGEEEVVHDKKSAVPKEGQRERNVGLT